MDDKEFIWRGVPIPTNAEVIETMKLLARSGTKDDALEFIDDYATYLNTVNPDKDGYEIAFSNMGYMIGYETKEDSQALYEFFEIGHPVLGDKPWELTPEEIFKKGIEWGESLKNKEAK